MPNKKNKAQRDALAKLNEVQRDALARHVKDLRKFALGWEGPCHDQKDPITGRKDDLGDDRAARLRAEARMVEENPSYFTDMNARQELVEWIANNVTAESEALIERQSARAKKPRPRPWHAVADPHLDELRGKHPDWYRSTLRIEVEKRLEKLWPELQKQNKKLKAERPGADALDAHIKRREEDGSLAKRTK